jgi:hypothetical protein
MEHAVYNVNFPRFRNLPVDIWDFLRADVRAKAGLENDMHHKKSSSTGGAGTSGGGGAGNGSAGGVGGGGSEIALKLAAAASPLTVLHLQNSSRCCNLC